jgi:sulfate adenylyltransferase
LLEPTDVIKGPRLPRPHGGALTDALAAPGRARELRDASREWASWGLSPRQLCDLELIANGAFSPLEGFLGRADYESVVDRMRLSDGTLWPMPVVLDVPEAVATAVGGGGSLVLRDPEGAMLAVLHVEECWRPDRRAEASSVYGTTDRDHPGVTALLDETHPWYLGGRLEVIALPTHYEFERLRLSPAALRAAFERDAWDRVAAFHTRSPLHRVHHAVAVSAARRAGARLLLHPAVGPPEAGDVDRHARVRSYCAFLRAHPDPDVRLAILPLATRSAGPREAVWHAIVRQNFGCSHLVVGVDHAGAVADAAGRPFYEPYAAQALLSAHAAELDIRMVPAVRTMYVPEIDSYVPEDEVSAGQVTREVPEREQRRLVTGGLEVPPWFSFPEVVAELRTAHPPRNRQGFTVFFTGLSGSGKSTIANVVLARLLEAGGRSVTLLDGDLVRKHLSSELGFSREDRDLNILRIGYVASEITKAGGVAICAPIAPYDRIRRRVRAMVEPNGGFVLVHVNTPLDICEARDRKGLYAKARAGVIGQFTGISDPYEPPSDADLVLDTKDVSPAAAADAIVQHLRSAGYL